MTATREYRIPTRFYDDHTDRDLPEEGTSTFVRPHGRSNVVVVLDRAAYDDLLSDARHYAGGGNMGLGPEYFGLVRSAAATVKALVAQGPPPDDPPDDSAPDLGAPGNRPLYNASLICRNAAGAVISTTIGYAHAGVVYAAAGFWSHSNWTLAYDAAWRASRTSHVASIDIEYDGGAAYRLRLAALQLPTTYR